MKIVRLTAENIKKLVAVEITPTGALVEITGANGAGKTSVLDAIWWALEGTKHIQAMPIRKGATKARIRLDLGELMVERRFNEKGSALTVESAQGARFTSPQGILDKLLGALTFDPLAFVNQEPEEQFKSLRKIVPLDVDLDQLDGLNRKDYDARTEISRQAKALRAQADGISVPEKLPEMPIDTGALKDRMAWASKISAQIEQVRAATAQKVREIKAARDKAKEALDHVERLRNELLSVELEPIRLTALADRLEAEPAEVEPSAIDVQELRADLDAAETVNRGIEQRERKRAIAAHAADLEGKAKELTELMDARDKAKADAIAKAPMPVPGLSFGDGIVTFDGVPFDQAETSAQIRVGVAIAMAANPKLRVIRIKEGSFLDEHNLALIAEMARARDYQVWVERVDTSGKIGIVIEDGMVVAVDGEPVAAAKESA